MPYLPPSYRDLSDATLNLLQAFYQTSKRYKPPSYVKLCEQIGRMCDRYKQRVDEKPATWFGEKLEPNPVHIDIIERINYLANHLPKSVKEDSPGQIQQHNILLGALFYPYLLIEDRYRGTLTLRFFSYMNWINVDNSALFQTLNEILEISEENKLDELSIVTRCSAYHEHLKSIKTNREDVAPYIPKGHDNFFKDLQTQIIKAKVVSKPMEQQLSYLREIQSFNTILSDTARNVTDGLRLYCQELSKIIIGKNELRREEMVKLLSSLNMTPFVSEIINYLLRDNEVLTNEVAAEFLSDMQARLATYNQYTLLGMYLIMLARCAKFDLVTKTLNITIGITPSSTIDKTIQHLALSALSDYLQKLSSTAHGLDCGPLWQTRADLLELLDLVDSEIALLQVIPVDSTILATL